MLKSIRRIVTRLFNKGTEYHDDFIEQQRSRLLNINIYLAWFITIPFILHHTWMNEYFGEFYLLLASSIGFLPFYILNIKGKTQLASIGILTFVISITYGATFIAETQIGASYFNIAFGSAALFFIRNKYCKASIAIYGYGSFLTLNYYQILNHPLEPISYFTIIFMLVALYIIIALFESENVRYQQILKTKNEILGQQNKTIKEQSDHLMELEKEAYEKELALKQKDIDQVLANNRMQVKIRENLLSQLERATNEKDSFKLIKSLKFDLRSQIQTQKKLEFSEDNIQELNAEFFERLNSEFPKLSKKEAELCSYIKLGLSTKEIAQLLSTTENTIYVTKNRLRSKLNLDSNDEVNQFLKEF
ncbi:MAG: LuxR C-terminal-related transcriptional regulator [bacterium]|nr:LuxR C-terminal-related transcriptional regulator [bacterium]